MSRQRPRAGADESATSRSRSRDRSWIAWHEQEVEQLRAKYEEEFKTIRDREPPPVSWEDLWHIAQQYPDIPSDGIICGDSTSHCRAGLNLCADCGPLALPLPSVALTTLALTLIEAVELLNNLP